MRDLTAARPVFGNKKKDKGSAERAALLEDLDYVVREIERNRRYFNLTEDEDLMDALIYEYSALMARYRYLLRQARGAGVRPGQPARAAIQSGSDGTCLTPSVSGDF